MARFEKQIYRLRPWYHDFEALSVTTCFKRTRRYGLLGPWRPGISGHADQQPRKESILRPYIERALGNLPDDQPVRILDLFCADGYYGLLAKSLCPRASLTGVDFSDRFIRMAATMADTLGFNDCEYHTGDVVGFAQTCDNYDIVINAGGLYHLLDPRRLLELLRPKTVRFMVVQSAVASQRNDPDYFVAPRVPDEDRGSWFTHARLGGWLQELGYDILDQARNAREGVNPEQIAGSFYLVATGKDSPN